MRELRLEARFSDFELLGAPVRPQGATQHDEQSVGEQIDGEADGELDRPGLNQVVGLDRDERLDPDRELRRRARCAPRAAACRATRATRRRPSVRGRRAMNSAPRRSTTGATQAQNAHVVSCHANILRNECPWPSIDRYVCAAIDSASTAATAAPDSDDSAVERQRRSRNRLASRPGDRSWRQRSRYSISPVADNRPAANGNAYRSLHRRALPAKRLARPARAISIPRVPLGVVKEIT